MRRFMPTILAALAVGGCAHPPVTRPVAEIRPGAAPGVADVRHDATYALVALDRPDAPPLVRSHLHQGQQVGFRRAGDQSVAAFAGAQTFPLPEGEFAWLVVPGTGPDWRVRAGDNCRRCGEAAKSALVLTAVAVLVVGGGALYILCHSNAAF